MKKDKKSKKNGNLKESIKGKEIFLSLPIIILIVILVVVTIKPFHKATNQIIVKEKKHEINDNMITISYTIKNDKEEDYKLDSIFIDLKNSEGKVVSGYLISVDTTFEKGETKEYTIEKKLLTDREISTVSFRCDECQES